jgi:hypothetical protein
MRKDLERGERKERRRHCDDVVVREVQLAHLLQPAYVAYAVAYVT